MRRVVICTFGIFSLACLSTTALAGSHTWRFNEVFSNANGKIQFFELKCDISGENFTGGLHISTTAPSTPDFVFSANVVGDTANKKILFGTIQFDTYYHLLPGGPHVDHIIPDGFVPINGGTLWYNPTSNYDKWVYGAGVIPTDGTHSVQFTSFNPGSASDTFTTTVNTPTNFNGNGGFVDGTCLDGDGDGYGNPGNSACLNGAATDCNDTNALVHPGATEASSAECSDGLDNDCDGQIDLADAHCVPTVSEWGALSLALLTLSAGSIMLRQRT